MSRVIGALATTLLVAALAGCAKPIARGECEPPDPTSPEWTEQEHAPRVHRIDGLFGTREWDGIVPLEGMYTDLYLDYQAPYLYALNDWRANVEGINPDCYNEFGVSVGSTRVTVKVYGDGRIKVDDADFDGMGAYSFSSTARWSVPHTIYEFRLTVNNTGPVCISLKDPTSFSNCWDLAREPMLFVISNDTFTTRVARVPDDDVVELAEGATCGHGEGICRAGLSCTEEGDTATCVRPAPPDGDDDVKDAGTSDADPDGSGEGGLW